MTDRSSFQSSLGLLGLQINLALNAFRAPEESFYCHVRHETLKGNVLLTGDGQRRFLVYDSLPGLAQIKAIGVDKKSLLVELSPFDTGELAEQRWPKGTRIGVNGIWHGQRRLAFVSRTTPDETQEVGPRACWMIDHAKLSAEDLDLAIRLLDFADENGLYLLEASQGQGSPVANDGAPRLELRMTQQLQLIQEREWAEWAE